MFRFRVMIFTMVNMRALAGKAYKTEFWQECPSR